MKDRSPWIELHLSVVTHRKTWALADALHVDRITALGHVCALWLWTVEQAQDGDLSSFPDRAVAEAAGWRKSPARFVGGLEEAGYLDADRRLHEWSLYVQPLMDRRAKERERLRNRRATDAQQNTNVAGHRLPHRLPSTTPSTVGVLANASKDPPNPPLARGEAERAARARSGSRRTRDVIALENEPKDYSGSVERMRAKVGR